MGEYKIEDFSEEVNLFIDEIAEEMSEIYQQRDELLEIGQKILDESIPPHTPDDDVWVVEGNLLNTLEKIIKSIRGDN